jgi:16S rRNA (guanine966-N2)-methyltransferase
MRIIGGLYKGRRIKAIKGLQTRPTLDMVRESLFNIIGTKIIDCCFADLFAGTGAVGLEALSRGARFATFVEKNAHACNVIKQNIKLLEVQDKYFVAKGDVINQIKKMDSQGHSFDIIFMDPPYNQGKIMPCLIFLQKSKLLKNDAWVIIQHSIDEELFFHEFTCFKQKKYGTTLLSFLK